MPPKPFLLPTLGTGNDAVFDALISRVVNDSIFPKKQFITLERELDVDGKVAGKCLKELKLDKDCWHTIKKVIRKRLTRRRNNAQLSVRRSLLRKLFNLRTLSQDQSHSPTFL